VAQIHCDESRTISLEIAEYVAASSEDVFRFIGSKGALQLQMTVKPEGVRKEIIFEKAADDGVTSTTVWSGSEDPGHVHGHLLKDFAAAIQNRSSPLTTLERALVVQNVTDAIYGSSSRGEAVSVIQ